MTYTKLESQLRISLSFHIVFLATRTIVQQDLNLRTWTVSDEQKGTRSNNLRDS